jgi:hypothetical protein
MQLTMGKEMRESKNMNSSRLHSITILRHITQVYTQSINLRMQIEDHSHS